MSLRRIKLTRLNEHLVCVLCDGYFVEATTITECLHTFCRVCIVKYLENCSYCPVCEVQVHRTNPVCALREDKTLQDIVFKLVPGLFQKEMERRAVFYAQHPEAAGDRTSSTLKEKRHFFHVDDQISLSLEFLPPAHAHAHALGLRPLRAPSLSLAQPPDELLKKDADENMPPGDHHDKQNGDKNEKVRVPQRRYLKCPAASQIRLLEKFVRLKYNLTSQHRVDIVHGGDCLSPELTLLDVVYMYKWTEDQPLKLQYTVISPPMPIRKRKLAVKLKTIAVESPPKKPKIDLADAKVNGIVDCCYRPSDNNNTADNDDKSDKLKTDDSLVSIQESTVNLSDIYDDGGGGGSHHQEIHKDGQSNNEANSLNSSRDDADDAMVIDESVNVDNSDKESMSSCLSNTDKVAPKEETPVTTSSVSSIESLKSLVQNSDYTLLSTENKTPIVSSVSVPKCDASCLVTKIHNISKTALAISTSALVSTVQMSASTTPSVSNSINPKVIPVSSDKSNTAFAPYSEIIKSVPSIVKTKNCASAVTFSTESKVSTSNNAAVLINNPLSSMPRNIKPVKSVNHTTVSNLVPLAPKITPRLPAQTDPTASLKTPVISTKIPNSPSAAVVSSAVAPTPRNLISNSYRANMQLFNSVRMNGVINQPRTIFDPTKPRLGRPPKSVKNSMPVSPRVGSMNRVLAPSNIGKQTNNNKSNNLKSQGKSRSKQCSSTTAVGQNVVANNGFPPTHSFLNHLPLTKQGSHISQVGSNLSVASTPLLENGNSNHITNVLYQNTLQNLNKNAKGNNSVNQKPLPNGIHPIANGKETKSPFMNSSNPIPPSHQVPLYPNIPPTSQIELANKTNGKTAQISTLSPSNATDSPKSSSSSLPSSTCQTNTNKTKSVHSAKPLKSPGNGNNNKTKTGTGATPKILEIAETLVNKQLQQMSQKQTVNPAKQSPHSPHTPSSPSTLTQALNTSTTLGLPDISKALNNSAALGLASLPQALQAAYMADYAAVHNLLSLSQAAVRMNMAMNCLQESADKNDSAPIDLSPTNKASSVTSNSPRPAKQSRKAPSVVVSGQNGGTIINNKTLSVKPATNQSQKTSAKNSSTLEAKDAQTPSTQHLSSKTTIFPPTPEVTITKLPSTSSDSSSTSSTTSSSNTITKTIQPNTISITKRATTTNATNNHNPAVSASSTTTAKFLTTPKSRSPSNASVRQIPNPSLLSHQSETRSHQSSLASLVVSSKSSPPQRQTPVSPTSFTNNNCNSANMNKTVVKVDL